MKFREASLRGAKGFNQIYGTDYYQADLRGADFSTAVLLDRTNFRKAKVDQYTRWPKGFDVKDLGLEFVETKPEEKDSPKNNPTPASEKSEADFQKLDKNEDRVLSGSEMKGLDAKDTDGDGEISLAEFLGNALKRDSEMQKGNPGLLGVWQAVSIEKGGKKAPAEMAKLLRMTFRKDALIVRGNHKDENEDRCSYKIDDSKTPKQFEFSMDDESERVLGIYRIENGILEICTRRPETKLGRPESFDASKDNSIVHMKLERLDSE
jgi:uncharacterized protein (TIGR03067 family)